jgi:hypothetical protein
VGRLTVIFNYSPLVFPEAPSALRQLAYRENIAQLIGRSGDPQGWETLPVITMHGTIFKSRPIEAICTVSASHLVHILPVLIKSSCHSQSLSDEPHRFLSCRFAHTTAALLHPINGDPARADHPHRGRAVAPPLIGPDRAHRPARAACFVLPQTVSEHRGQRDFRPGCVLHDDTRRGHRHLVALDRR